MRPVRSREVVAGSSCRSPDVSRCTKSAPSCPLARRGSLAQPPPEQKRASSRHALSYALLDCSDRIGLEHLEAGLAVWRYSADSAQWVFGDTLGDPTADEI